MSNLGLYRALDEAGIAYEQTNVGDRFVYENMVQTGNCIGGEQSGHIILSKYATTGDGILTAIKLAEAVVESKQSLKKLASPVVMLPQVLKNVRVKDKAAVRNHALVQEKVEEMRNRLGKTGRILLRESGTEPVVRVMVEAMTFTECETYAQEVVDRIYACNLADTD
jgi:phosphoglucosamine mutase